MQVRLTTPVEEVDLEAKGPHVADLLVPRLGVTVKEVTVVEWLVEDGETVSAGQPLVTVATDKTEVEIESTEAGVLRHRAKPEEDHPVGAVIGVIE